MYVVYNKRAYRYAINVIYTHIKMDVSFVVVIVYCFFSMTNNFRGQLSTIPLVIFDKPKILDECVLQARTFWAVLVFRPLWNGSTGHGPQLASPRSGPGGGGDPDQGRGGLDPDSDPLIRAFSQVHNSTRNKHRKTSFSKLVAFLFTHYTRI